MLRRKYVYKHNELTALFRATRERRKKLLMIFRSQLRHDFRPDAYRNREENEACTVARFFN